MCPHSAHLRRCSHQPPPAKHSTQPVPLGLAVGLIPSLSDFIGSSLNLAQNQFRRFEDFFWLATPLYNYRQSPLKQHDKSGRWSWPLAILFLTVHPWHDRRDVRLSAFQLATSESEIAFSLSFFQLSDLVCRHNGPWMSLKRGMRWTFCRVQ